MKTEVKVISGSIFDDENSGDVLFVGSNARKACESPSAVLSQVMGIGGPDVTAMIRGYLFDVNEIPDQYSAGSIVEMFLPRNSQGNGLKFGSLFIGFHLTGDLITLREMMIKGICDFFPYTDVTGGEKAVITLPLIGTNVGGVLVKDWALILRDLVNELDGNLTSRFDEIRVVSADSETLITLREIFEDDVDQDYRETFLGKNVAEDSEAKGPML